jgi:hypothetical protein
LRYAKNGKCAKKTETKVLLNQIGVDGKNGANGTNGTNGSKGDTGSAGASSPTGFTARSVCGANGTTLCAIGVRGPGGGTIFYVDSTNELLGYDYLEVAPTDAVFASGAIGRWSTDVRQCGNGSVDASGDCSSGSTSVLVVLQRLLLLHAMMVVFLLLLVLPMQQVRLILMSTQLEEQIFLIGGCPHEMN